MTLKHLFFISLLFLSLPYVARSQSGTCNGAEVFCGSNAYNFPTSTNTSPEPGPCYSCLSSQQNPAWYFMQVGSTGSLTITLYGMAPGDPPDSLDIDFICWGPFPSPTGACVTGLTCDKVVDCSYSGFSFETCVIPNAIAGEFYMLLITNYSNLVGNITFQQSNSGQPGSGTTNCTIVEDCSLLSLSPVASACDPGTATFDVNGMAEFTNPPTTGTLVIKDITAVPPVQTTLYPPFNSPLNYTLSGIPCDGLTHNIYAIFSEAGNPCEFSATVQAPVAPCPSGVLSGGGPICLDGTSQATISIAVAGAAGPYNFVYALDGVNQPPVNNYSGPLPFILTTNVPGVYSLVSTSNNNCSGTSSGTATVSLVPLPSAPQSTGINYYTCGTGTVTLSVISVPGTLVNWYTAPTGGTALFTGTSFTTPVISASTTYYAESETTIAGCKSLTRIPVFAEVRPIPSVSNTVTAMDICSDATWSVALTSNPSGADFYWTASAAPLGAVTGFADTGFGNTLGELLTNVSPGPGTVTYEVFPVLNQCSGISTPFLITVHPKPIPSFITSSGTVCEGSQNIVYATEAGMSNYLWNISPGGSITAGTGTNSVQVTWDLAGSGTSRWIEVNYTNTHGCTADSPTRFSVTVNPIPNIISNPQIQTICSGQNALIHFESTVPGTAGNTMFTWSFTAPAQISPNSMTGNGDLNQVFTNNGVTANNITFTVTATAAGCTSQMIGNLITVNPKPSVIFTATPANPQEICSGTSFSNVPLQSNVTVPGVTFGWTAAAFDPTNPTTAITGFTTPGSGNSIPGENISSLLLTQGVIKFSVTATYTSGIGCPGDAFEYQVLINPSPSVTLTPSDPLGQTLCSGTTSSQITFATNAQPTIYTWQAIENIGVNGALTNGTSDFIPAQTLTTTTAAQGHVKYKVTPIYQGSGTFNCPGGSSYSTITVNPLPEPAITGRSLVCELQPDEKYNTPAVAGNGYEWTITGASNIINQTTSEVTVTWGAYTLSPGTLSVTETINATGCQKTTPVKQVTLQQRPVPTISGPVINVCEGTGGHRYETEKFMTNYLWTVNGGAITSGGGAGNDFVIVTWNTPGLHSVEVNYTNSLQCSGFPSKVLPVTVHPLPNTAITIGQGPNCEGASHIYYVSENPECTFAWSIIPASSGDFTSGQGTDHITITWNSPGPVTLRVTGINTTTACSSTNIITMDIHPKPMPVFTPCFDIVTTPGARNITLKGAAPYISGQGVFTGNRVVLNSMTGLYEFNPLGASVGSYPLYYSFTNNYGCENAANPVTISVQNNFFSCGGSFTDPRDGKSYRTGMLSGKCWMIENLNYGSVTPNTPGTPQTDNCVPEKYCAPQYPNCNLLGGLYQWGEVMDYSTTPGAKGICPPEWHIPSETEWQQLIDNLINGISAPHANAAVAAELKDQNLTNGFNALLSGILYSNKQWAFTNGNLTGTIFWTSTPEGLYKAVSRGLNNFTSSISSYHSGKSNAFSVRCVKD